MVYSFQEFCGIPTRRISKFRRRYYLDFFKTSPTICCVERYYWIRIWMAGARCERICEFEYSSNFRLYAEFFRVRKCWFPHYRSNSRCLWSTCSNSNRKGSSHILRTHWLWNRTSHFL
eukprot:PhF_6_TR26650/c0_g1_i1/m.38636